MAESVERDNFCTTAEISRFHFHLKHGLDRFSYTASVSVSVSVYIFNYMFVILIYEVMNKYGEYFMTFRHFFAFCEKLLYYFLN